MSFRNHEFSRLGTGAVIDDSALVVNYGAAVNLSALAACMSGITGSGNLTAVSTGALTIDRAINLSGGNGTVVLAAGCGTAAGSAAGGDVTLTSAVSVGAGGTVTVFSGNPNTTTLEGELSGASGATQYKTYDAGYTGAGGAVSGTRNFYYRAADNVSLSATGTLASKTYDGTTGAVGDINASAVTVSESVADGNNMSFSSLATESATFSSPHALGVNGSAVEVSFGNTAHFSASGANWSVAGLTVGMLTGNGTITPADLTVTATSQSRTYDGTNSAASLVTVSGLASGDVLANAALGETYGSPHALGSDASTLNITAALSNGSFASGSTGYITDYNVRYATAAGTITPANLTVTATSQSKPYDGTYSASSLATVAGLASDDVLTNAALAEAYGSPHALGSDVSTLNVASALSNASFASGSVGYITDYNVGYVTAPGTITPANLTVTATSQSRTYDGTDSASSLATVAGLASDDVLTNAALAEAYGSPHALGSDVSTLNVASALSNTSFPSGSVGYITDYNVGYVTAAGTITPANLTVTATSQSRTYDGTDSATSLSTVAGLVSGDVLTNAALAEAYGSPHALGSDVSTLNVASALSNTSFVSGSVGYITDYNVGYVTAAGTITPANLTVTATGQSRTYDGTDSATSLATVAGLVSGDVLTNAALAEAYGSPHALGTNASRLNVTAALSNASFASGSVGYITDYNVGYVTAAGTITPANLTVTATGQSKTYDGTDTAANLVTVSGLAAGDVLTNAAVGETYGSPHALGSDASILNITAALSNASFASGSTGYITDYNVGYVTAAGTITPANLTVTATSQSKPYDGTDSATSLVTVFGLVGPDMLSNAALAEAYTSPHALGTGGSTLNIAAALSNASFASGSTGYITDYNVGYVTAAGTITPANLTVTAASQSKPYDGTDTAASLVTVSGLAAGDVLTNAALGETYGSPHALGSDASTLNIAATLSNASFASGSTGYITDYNVGYVTAAGTITPANLTVTATSQSKPYDGTDSATSLVTVSGLAAGDVVTNAALGETYGSPHALGSDASTLNITAALSNASFASGSVGYITDYTVDYVPAAGTITPASLTLAATSQTKNYDGTDSAASLATASGLAPADSLTPAALAEAYSSPHALGTDASTLNTAVALSNASFASGSVGYITDYTVDYVPAAGTITPASLTLAATSQTKTYDGTDSAASLATASGLARVDSLTPAALAEAYSSPHALGSGGSTLNITAALSNASFASGSVGYISDYTVDYVSAAGTIRPASLTLAATSQTKTYDGTDSAASLATASGLVPADSLTPAALAEAYSSPHALGTDASTLNTPVALSNASFASGSVGYITDYNVGYVTAAGTITPANMTVTATSQSKPYDGTDTAASLVTVCGLAAGDVLTNAALGETYGSPHALGTGSSTLNIAAALSSASFASGSTGYITDYNVGYVTAAGTITPANLTVTATWQSKPYDGTDSATSLVTVSGLAAGDVVTNVALGETYGSPHALGSDASTLNITAALSNASFASGSVGYITDYTVDYVPAAGTITPASLTLAATSQTKNYDGTDSAAGLAMASGLASTDALTPAALAEAYSSPHALGNDASTLNMAATLSNASFASGSVGYISDYDVDYMTAAGTIMPATLTLAATSQTKTYDGTVSAASLATVSGLASTDALTPAALAEAYTSPHVLGTDGSTLNFAAALSNASFTSGSVGYITDYNVGYVMAAGTITPAILALTATSQSKTYDGTNSAVSLATASGLASSDALTPAALVEVYSNPHVLGTDASTLNVAAALSNASFANGSVGHITDYDVTYTPAEGTITPAMLDIASGSNFTLYDVPTTTLADMSGNVQPGQGYVSDYFPMVINNGNLSFAGPNAATLTSLTGTGNLTVDANQLLTVTGSFTQRSVTAGSDSMMQQVESGVSAVEWARSGTMNYTPAVPVSSGMSVVDGALCTRPKQGSKVCQ